MGVVHFDRANGRALAIDSNLKERGLHDEGEVPFSAGRTAGVHTHHRLSGIFSISPHAKERW